MHLELTPEQDDMAGQRDRHSPATASGRSCRNRRAPANSRSTLVAEAASRGYLGLLVPREFGGKALDHVSYALTIEAVARASATVAVILAVHNSLVCDVIAQGRHGGSASSSGSAAWRPAKCLARLPSRRPMRAPTPRISRPSRRASTAATASAAARSGSPTARSPASRLSLPRPIQARVVVASRHFSCRSTRAVCDAIPASIRSACAGWAASTWCWTTSR